MLQYLWSFVCENLWASVSVLLIFVALLVLLYWREIRDYFRLKYCLVRMDFSFVKMGHVFVVKGCGSLDGKWKKIPSQRLIGREKGFGEFANAERVGTETVSYHYFGDREIVWAKY